MLRQPFGMPPHSLRAISACLCFGYPPREHINGTRAHAPRGTLDMGRCPIPQRKHPLCKSAISQDKACDAPCGLFVVHQTRHHAVDHKRQGDTDSDEPDHAAASARARAQASEGRSDPRASICGIFGFGVGRTFGLGGKSRSSHDTRPWRGMNRPLRCHALR